MDIDTLLSLLTVGDEFVRSNACRAGAEAADGGLFVVEFDLAGFLGGENVRSQVPRHGGAAPRIPPKQS